MITFTCSACGRTYSVPDASAGRQARCRCGQVVAVPAPAAAAARASAALASPARATAGPSARATAAATAAAKLPMRTRRLLADAEQMARAFVHSPHIRVHPGPGDPPEVYEVEYHVRSLERGRGGQPVPRDEHRVHLQLTSDYPRSGPACKMLTPIFHPNIDPATVCVGDHWVAGERLVDLVVRIGEILAFQAYNIKSPLDAEAAMWADLNASKLPTDPRNLRPPEMD